MKKLLAIYLLTVSISSFGQDSFKKEIDKIYNFHPHKISQAEQQKMIPALENFFELVQADTTKYLPLLRQELKSNDHFSMFLF